MQSRDLQISCVLIAVVLVVSLPLFWDRPSADLAPMWIAAALVAEGNWAQVYPDLGPVFTVTTPEIWSQVAAAEGHRGLPLPYIYPPLWAGLLAPLTDQFSLTAFQNVFQIINHLALFGILILARRVAAPDVPLALYLILGLFVFVSGPYAPLALFQNQPQILVSFLVLLAIERGTFGAPFAAGACLALATALKVSPILLLPLLLAMSDWRRVLVGFVVVGGGLGLGSLMVAGWDVHVTYLSLLGTISSTVVVSEYAYTLDALVAQFQALNSMDYIELNPSGDVGSGWWVGPKSGFVSVGISVAMVVVALGLATIATNRPNAFLWPTTMIFATLLGSIAWSFHYIAPLAFLPALVGWLGNVRGALACVALALPGTYLVLPLARDSAVLPFADQALGVLSLTVMAIVFLFLAFRADQDLHRASRRV